MTPNRYGLDRHRSHVAADVLSSDLEVMRERLPAMAALADAGDGVAAAIEEELRASIAEIEADVATLYAAGDEWEDDE